MNENENICQECGEELVKDTMGDLYCPACCDEREYNDDMDGDFDSAMASAGLGTDEDYGYYGGGEE